MKPIDIEMKEFKKAAFGGYQAEDVDEFLDAVTLALESAQYKNIELEDKVKLLSESLSHYKEMESTLKNTLILAEKTSQETKDIAHKKAEQIILEATLKADKMEQEARQEMYLVRQKIEVLKTQYASAKIQIKQILQSQLEMLETETTHIKDVHSITMDEEETYYTKEYQIINEEDAI